ncbi:MAG: rhodanese-like domain-containing protein [Firmicutes bacterium]|nr:rhodanese-like domain-containing protein [Bacillota bacterium]
MRRVLSTLAIVLILSLVCTGVVLAVDQAVVDAGKAWFTDMKSFNIISTAAVYKDLARYTIVDVRTEKEFAQGHIEGAINIPLQELADRYDEIPSDKPVIVHCKSGARSSYATAFLQMLGYRNVQNMFGGYLDWVDKGYPVVK